MVERGVSWSMPLMSKLALVVLYIRKQAGGKIENVDAVPCPSMHEWAELSSGRHPVLPPVATLGMYANTTIRTRAKQAHGGNLLETYFDVAKRFVKQV